jgi:hypothetical protein
MKKLLSLIILVVAFGFRSGDKMVKVKITEGVNCQLPTNFFPMTDGDIYTRMPTNKKPIAAYTDESRLIDFVVTSATSRWRKEDIEIAKDFYKANITHLYDEVEFTKEEVVTINKKQFAVFEFTSLVKGDKLSKKSIRKYAYVQYTIVGNQTMVFAFNAPERLKDKWSATAELIMNSLKVK